MGERWEGSKDGEVSSVSKLARSSVAFRVVVVKRGKKSFRLGKGMGRVRRWVIERRQAIKEERNRERGENESSKENTTRATVAYTQNAPEDSFQPRIYTSAPWAWRVSDLELGHPSRAR